MDNLSIEKVSLSEWPLSRRYSLVLFERLALRMTEGTATRSEITIYWALGVLQNGEYEVAGIWLPSVQREMAWSEVFATFKSRGVQGIGLVGTCGVSISDEELLGIYPKAVLLSPNDARAFRGQPQANRLPGRYSRLAHGGFNRLARAEGIARILNRAFSSSVSRRRRILEIDNATSYVADQLSQAERRMQHGAHRTSYALPRDAASQ